MPPPDTTLAVREEPSVALMLQKVIEGGITNENVAALEKMCDLYERMEAKRAEREFIAAFVKLQQETPRIKATQAVPNNDGGTRYKFAPYEEIMQQVQPLLTAHGFSISFNTRREEGRITAICTMMHSAGHSRANEFAVRIGQGPPKANEAQSDAAAKTLAKRGALSDALNIVIEKDTDGADSRSLGGKITPERAAELEKRVKATKSDVKKFLEFAEADSFANIDEAAYSRLDAVLKKREAGKLPTKPPGAAPCDAEGNLL